MAEIGKNIVQAKQLLMAGQPVAIPTETVYGLAVNALDAQAVSRVFDIKKRPLFDPLIVHVATADRADQYVRSVPPKAKRLMHAFWPGPLTLVLPKKRIIPSRVTANLDTVGMRCPRNILTHQLLCELPFPLAAPSANPFGYISPTTPAHVQAQLGAHIPYILDGGSSEIGLESTIIGFEENTPVLYRLGGIDQAAIESEIGAVRVAQNTAQQTVAPGSLPSHYAPRKRMIVGDIHTLIPQFAHRAVGVLCFQKTPDNVPSEFVRTLSPSGSLQEAARRLFGLLRQLDQMDIDVILAERVPHVGIGVAINDRLGRAAAEKRE